MKGSCHCGRVTASVPAPPGYINPCNCSLCMKAGAAWGYYRLDEVAIEGETRAYRRADKGRPSIAIHFCGTCGATISWTPEPHVPQDRMAVNMRLFDPGDLAGVTIEYGDQRSEPEREEGYHPPTIFDGKGAIP